MGSRWGEQTVIKTATGTPSEASPSGIGSGCLPENTPCKVVVLGEPMFDSPGSDVSIESLIVFEAR